MKPIVKILAGSYLYGTNVEGSDRDHKVVMIPSPRDILLQRVKDSENRKDSEGDLEIWSLQQFLKLLCQGQTNAMDMLFAPESYYVGRPGAEWLSVVENRERFVSKNCRAFVGYCRQQARKYVVKLDRQRAINHAVGYFLSAAKNLSNPGQVKIRDLESLEQFAMHNSFTELVPVETAHGTELKHLSVCDTMVPLTASVKLALDTFERKSKEYGARAKAAAAMDDTDWKSLYHAVRVAHEAIELMETGKLIFPRPEKELLLDIRCGRVPFDVVSDMIEENLVRVEEAVERSRLPEKPDYDFADRLVESFYRSAVL